MKSRTWIVDELDGEFIVYPRSNERFRIDSNGYLHLGVYPSAWQNKECYRFKTRDFAEVQARFCERMDDIADEFFDEHVEFTTKLRVLRGGQLLIGSTTHERQRSIHLQAG